MSVFLVIVFEGWLQRQKTYHLSIIMIITVIYKIRHLGRKETKVFIMVIISKRKRSLFPECCCITVVGMSLTLLLLFPDVLVFCCEFLGSSFFKKKPAKMKPEGKKLLNIVILGISFMFLFTAFQTCGNIEVSFPKQILEKNSTNLQIRHTVDLFSKQLSRASTAPSSMGVATQGEV